MADIVELLKAVVAEEALEYSFDAPEAIERGERPDLWDREITIPVEWASQAATLIEAQAARIEDLESRVTVPLEPTEAMRIIAGDLGDGYELTADQVLMLWGPLVTAARTLNGGE